MDNDIAPQHGAVVRESVVRDLAQTFQVGDPINKYQYIDCYVVASRGKLMTEKWIKPFSDEYIDSNIFETKLTYSGVLTRDIKFKAINRGCMPSSVKVPHNENCKMYLMTEEHPVADTVNGNVASSCQPEKLGRIRDSMSRRKRKERQEISLNRISLSQLIDPPPVPPKPKSFHTLDNADVVPPTMQPRKSANVASIDTLSIPINNRCSTSEEKINLTKAVNEPIRLPRRKLKINSVKSDESAVSTPEYSQADNVSKMILSLPTADVRAASPRSSSSHSETDIILHYNISTCSSNTLTYERSLGVEDHQYESVDPASPPVPHRATTGRNADDCGNPENSEKIEETIYGMYSEPYESAASLTLLNQVRSASPHTRTKISQGIITSPVEVLVTTEKEKSESSGNLSMGSSVSVETRNTTCSSAANAGDTSDGASTNSSIPDRRGRIRSTVGHPDFVTDYSCPDDSIDIPIFVTPDPPMIPTIVVQCTNGSSTVLPKLPNRVKSKSDFIKTDSIESDTYEEIDALPVPLIRRSPQRLTLADEESGNSVFTVSQLEDKQYQTLRKDDIVIVEIESACTVEKMDSFNSSDTDELLNFQGTHLCYDKNGNAFYILSRYLKCYGDPEGCPWFYPLAISSWQAAMFLQGEKHEGCFLVYRNSPSKPSSYTLSVCRNNGEVLHYSILEGRHGSFKIKGHDHSFMTLTNLVEYFQRNKSFLATRLRRPLKEVRLAITPGYHYEISYELQRRQLSLTGKIIGKANFGVVCLGVYKRTEVAVKVLQDTEPNEDNFLEEAVVMMGLNHEHVVQIVGVSFSVRPFYIVTEYVGRGSLKNCLRNGTISATKVDNLIDVCRQILSAMTYLEGIKYVLHRNLAAKNFLVTEALCVKLSDFGRARRVCDDHYQASREETISVKWASPEVLASSDYSTKSDVWAAGVVMWEAFSAGERPYESLTGEQAAVYVTEGGRLYRPALCPEGLYALMVQCWQRNSASRPSFNTLNQQFKHNRKHFELQTMSKGSIAKVQGSSNMLRAVSVSPKLCRADVTVVGPSRHDSFKQKLKSSVSGPILTGKSIRAREELFVKMGYTKTSHTSSSSELSLGSTLPTEELSRIEKLNKGLRKWINKKPKPMSAFRNDDSDERDRTLVTDS